MKITPDMIRTAQQVSGLTTAQCAKMLDVSPRIFNDWKCGTRQCKYASYALLLLLTASPWRVKDWLVRNIPDEGIK